MKKIASDVSDGDEMEQGFKSLTSPSAVSSVAGASSEDWKEMALKQGDRCLQLEGRIAELEFQCRAMERFFGGLLSRQCEACPRDHHCPSRPVLEGQCVLYLGYEGSHSRWFKVLVESQEGQFLHCDESRVENSVIRKLVAQSDLVVCSLDKVSEATLKRVRSYCQYHLTRLLELPQTRLSTFTQALERADVL